jgi:hypothetical protein
VLLRISGPTTTLHSSKPASLPVVESPTILARSFRVRMMASLAGSAGTTPMFVMRTRSTSEDTIYCGASPPTTIRQSKTSGTRSLHGAFLILARLWHRRRLPALLSSKFMPNKSPASALMASWTTYSISSSVVIDHCQPTRSWRLASTRPEPDQRRCTILAGRVRAEFW